MKKIIWLLILLVTILFLGWFYFINSKNQQNIVRLSDGKINNNELNYKLITNNQGQESINLVVTEIPILSPQEPKKIYYYFDERYPIMGSSLSSYNGVYEHLLAEFKQKGIDQNINLVNADGLPDVMKDNNNMVIMASGDFPDTVYSNKLDLVSSWLREGGSLIWVGDGLGYYFGSKGIEIKTVDSPNTIGWSGQRKILGTNFLEGEYIGKPEDSMGLVPSYLARALGIKSQYTQVGALLSALNGKDGNEDLGFHFDLGNDVRTSLSEISVGEGKVILFGNILANREIDVAWDISQLIATDFLNSDAEKISTDIITIVPNEQGEISRHAKIGDSKEVRVIVFSPDYSNRYYYTALYVKGD